MNNKHISLQQVSGNLNNARPMPPTQPEPEFNVQIIWGNEHNRVDILRNGEITMRWWTREPEDEALHRKIDHYINRMRQHFAGHNPLT